MKVIIDTETLTDDITAIAASSEDGNFPVENVQNDYTTDLWKANGVPAAVVTAAVSKGSGVAVLNTNATSIEVQAGSGATYELESGDENSVEMTYAASGSSGITVADNDNINFGTGNFTLVWKGSLPDWTPSAACYIAYKDNGANGYEFYVNTNGKLGYYNRASAANYASSVATGLTDGTEHQIAFVVTPGTSVVFYVDGAQLGNSVAVASGNVSSNATLYINGTSAIRNPVTAKSFITFNRALSAAEVLSLYQSGIADADKWGSQTALTSGTLTVGKKYRINVYNADDDFTNVGAAGNVAGTEFVATGTTPTHWAHSSSLVLLGATLDLEPEGITDAKWTDASTNSLHATYPTAGTTVNVVRSLEDDYSLEDSESYISQVYNLPGTAGRFWADYPEITTPHVVRLIMACADDETLYAGIVRAGNVEEFNDPQYGLEEDSADYSVEKELNNGGMYFRKKNVVRTFSNIGIVDARANCHALKHNIFDAIGPKPLAMRLVHGNITDWEFVLFAKRLAPPKITHDAGPVNSRIQLSLKEVT